MVQTMKFTRFTVLILAALMLATAFSSSLLMAADDASSSGSYRHVVLFKFKDEATAEQVKEIEVAFAQLPKQIAAITDYEWGTNVSPEGLDDGFTHCFFVSFANKEGLEIYIPHEAHQAFVSKLKPILDKVCVVDYIAKSGA